MRDLRSLIEAHCEKWHNVYTQVAVEASTPGTQRIKTEFAVIYCTFIPSVYADKFVDNHFLTTRTAKILPRHELAVDYLYFILTRLPPSDGDSLSLTLKTA